MWNFCFVCGCPSVRALQGIRIQSLIQHTVIRICIMDLLHSSKSDHGTKTTFSPTHWGLYKVSVVSFFAILNIFCKISLSGDKSSLVQTMAWCHQATNHYLIQYWPSSTSPYDVTRPLARQNRGLSWQRVNNCKWLSNSYIQNSYTFWVNLFVYYTYHLRTPVFQHGPLIAGRELFDDAIAQRQLTRRERWLCSGGWKVEFIQTVNS